MEDFPIVCSQCLGDKEHIKMVRQPAGEECKLCTRPFTVFRWNILQEQKQLKKTIFCKTCAQSRNCCQSCMLDVTYGIPLEIRDAALKMAGIRNEWAPATSTLNREVKAIVATKLEAKQKKEETDLEKQREKAKAVLELLASKISSGAIQPKTSKVKRNDVPNREVSKIVAKLPFGGNLDVPEDGTAKSFFVFGFSPEMPQYVLSSYCEKFGTLSAVKVVHRAQCAYVTFLKRAAAESFAQAVSENGLNANKSTAGLLILERYPVRVAWGNPRPLGTTNDEHSKISMVVAKVMSQLADKDNGVKHNGAKDNGTKQKKKTEQKRYKAASEDLEL